MRFYDPDKHIVEIGEILEEVVARLFRQGCSPDEIARKTGMPLEFVEGSIKNPKARTF